jgi:UDP-N-acetylglucosamine 2-epimerase (hydrolysing)
VQRYYGCNFPSYSILLFHPVTTEIKDLRQQVAVLVDEVLASGRNFVVIYPNNDLGNGTILEEYERLRNNPRIAIYPSMRFEYFLTLLKNAQFILGNSSAGTREAPHFGVPSINLGTRQNNRVSTDSVLNTAITAEAIRAAMVKASEMPREAKELFGNGNSAAAFHQALLKPATRDIGTQKFFIDRSHSKLERERNKH